MKSLREKLTGHFGSAVEADRVLSIVRDHDDESDAVRGRVRVTRQQLEDALDEFCHVDSISGRVTWSGDAGTVADVARALHGQLAAFNALRGTGNAEPLRCEHALESPASDELEAMDKIAALLRTRSTRSVKRILAWALDRLTDIGEPPF